MESKRNISIKIHTNVFILRITLIFNRSEETDEGLAELASQVDSPEPGEADLGVFRRGATIRECLIKYFNSNFSENFIYTYKFFLQYFFSNYFSFVHLNILSLGTCLATKICYKKCLDDPTLRLKNYDYRLLQDYK